MPDIDSLLSLTSSYLHGVDLEPLKKAYDFICQRHGRKSNLTVSSMWTT